MENYYDESYQQQQQRLQQRNSEYHSSQQQQQQPNNSFSKQDEQKNYPIGDSKDVDVGHTSNIINNNNNTNNSNDYDRNETQQHHDNINNNNEKPKHIYDRRNNNYISKTVDQKHFVRSNFAHQQTLFNEFGDYQDEKLSSPTKKQDYTSHTLQQSQQQQQQQQQQPPSRSEPNSSAGYTNETISIDFIKDKDPTTTTLHQNHLFKNKTKHQEVIRRLYDLENNNQVTDTLSKAKTYLVESPKSHGELVKIFTKNHKINPTKFQDSSLTSPTEDHFQRMLLNGNYDPISFKSMAQRNSRHNFNKSSFIQHMRAEQSAAAATTEHHPTYKTGRFIDIINKKPSVNHKKPLMDIYQKNIPYNNSLNNYQFDTIQPIKNVHRKIINDNNQAEIKYTNKKFYKNDFNHYHHKKDINNYNNNYNNHDDDNYLCNKSSSLSHIKNESTSDDKISDETKEYTRLTKNNKSSARSNRSKRSYNTHQSRKLEDMFNVHKSKCDIFNVITGGIQKLSHSRYDLVPQDRPVLPVTAAEKCSQTRTIHVDCSSNDKSLNVSSISNCNVFEPMLKEYKKYHLHNIKEEAQRLERLEHLSNKIEI